MLNLPYRTSGQELGETRQAMTKKLMQDLEEVINKYKDKREPYWVLVHAKPWPKNPQIIKIKIVPTSIKPPMMLSCMCFEVNNVEGKLLMNWVLPGDWPTWSVGGQNEPIPETIASIQASGITYHYDSLLPAA